MPGRMAAPTATPWPRWRGARARHTRPTLLLTTQAAYPLQLPQPLRLWPARPARRTLRRHRPLHPEFRATRPKRQSLLHARTPAKKKFLPASVRFRRIRRNSSKKFTAGSISSRSGKACSAPKTTNSASAPSRSSPRCATRASQPSPTSRSKSSSICRGPIEIEPERRVRVAEGS